LCCTDGIDGYLARRHGAATTVGAFLDPLADKVLILGAMIFLVNSGVFSVVPVVIIAARELAISLYRTFVGAKGVSVPASKIAKVKTLTQQLSVGFALAPLTALDAKWLWNGLAVGVRRAGAHQRWPIHVACSSTEDHRQCDVTSSRSAPNCCSGRSSTPTARGSASTSPRTASIPCCR
jgi:phosphatidylglycerophosphate synthase